MNDTKPGKLLTVQIPEVSYLRGRRTRRRTERAWQERVAVPTRKLPQGHEVGPQ